MIRKKSALHSDIKKNLSCILRIAKCLLLLDYENLLKKEDEFLIFVKLFLEARRDLDPSDEQLLLDGKLNIIKEHFKMLKLSEDLKNSFFPK